ncbi:hypothetical protein [Pedobacter ureilyticus]|uniref:Uncharacterized protein n=1 Tax=Pedobacter ureilyticus TaxID=1393051 RepID=A0ABW9J465_9SPHI|nr:hypothetical protein [Pedobacter helvus]
MLTKNKSDLNKDGLLDIVILIEEIGLKNQHETNATNLKSSERHLLVAFKRPDGSYKWAAKNTSIIPPKDDPKRPCLLDPFGENSGISTENSLIKIHLQQFYSCGAWEIYDFDYIFRYQNQKFELIGYNESSLHRSTGEEISTTVNFSTAKMTRTTGSNAFKKGAKPKTVWQNIKPKQRLELNSIKEEDLRAFD